MSSQNLEERVAALEEELGRLKQAVSGKPDDVWWREWVGAFLNDPAFEKAMNFGRRYRESLRPKVKNASKRKRKNGHS